jgi:hypothetical protein
VKINTQIKKLDHYDVHDRSRWEKLGAIVLTGLTVMSMVVESHDIARRVAKADMIANPEVVTTRPPEPPEKNEMVRSPIKFDDGLRAAATTGA